MTIQYSSCIDNFCTKLHRSSRTGVITDLAVCISELKHNKLFIKTDLFLRAGTKSTVVLSSLHCNISLSFCLFLYNGVCFDELNLSFSDIIVIQKGSKFC